jgi:hypothetical protein
MVTANQAANRSTDLLGDGQILTHNPRSICSTNFPKQRRTLCRQFKRKIT